MDQSKIGKLLGTEVAISQISKKKADRPGS
jgi:hypothetical protein